MRIGAVDEFERLEADERAAYQSWKAEVHRQWEADAVGLPIDYAERERLARLWDAARQRLISAPPKPSP